MKTKQLSKDHQKKMSALSIYLRECRFSEGLTQEEVANEILLHRNTIIRAENSKNITIETLFMLTGYYEVSEVELFSIIEETCENKY